MKHPTNRLLAGLFLLTLAAYLFFLWESLEGGGLYWPHWLLVIQPYLLLGFHALPAFFGQLFVCLAVKNPLLRLLPLLLIGAMALWGLWISLTYSGWDTLGGLILMAGSAAPAVGCALAWGVWGWERLTRFCEGAPPRS